MQLGSDLCRPLNHTLRLKITSVMPGERIFQRAENSSQTEFLTESPHASMACHLAELSLCGNPWPATPSASARLRACWFTIGLPWQQFVSCREVSVVKAKLHKHVRASACAGLTDVHPQKSVHANAANIDRHENKYPHRVVNRRCDEARIVSEPISNCMCLCKHFRHIKMNFNATAHADMLQMH